jgi:hypothetical protein
MDIDYIWRIDLIRNPALPQTAERLDILYGTFPTKEAAEKKIEGLKNLPQYRDADLVASKQRAPTRQKQICL